MLLLVDGSNLIHRMFHAMPATLSLEDATPIGAAKGFANKLISLLHEHAPSHALVAMDTLTADGQYHRRRLWPDYKMDRAQKDATLHPQIRICQKITEALGVVWVDSAGWEADDVIATAATAADGEVVVYSADSDLLALTALPRVQVLRASRQGEAFFDARETEKLFGCPPSFLPLYTAIEGGHNNVPGVPGLGPKAAQDILVAMRDLLVGANNEFDPGMIWRLTSASCCRVLTENGVPVKRAQRLAAILAKHRERLRLSLQLAMPDTEVPQVPPFPGLSRRAVARAEFFSLWRDLSFKLPSVDVLDSLSQVPLALEIS
jgi:5'-3' exonuclease